MNASAALGTVLAVQRDRPASERRLPVLRKKLSSISLSVTTLAKEIQEHSLSAPQVRAQRLGLVSALFCALLGSVKGWMVSQLAEIGPAQIVGLRSVGAICFLCPLVVYRRSKLTFDLRTNGCLLLRSLVGNVAVAGYYFGFAYLPLAEASLIFYSTPIYTTLIGCVFLGERCGFPQGVALLLCASGVALVSLPTLIFDRDHLSNLEFKQSLQGILGCLIGAVAQALAMVILRRLNNVNAEVVSLWWAVTGTVVCVGANGLTGKLVLWSCGFDSSLVVLLSLAGFLSELAMIVALHLEEAGSVSVALTSEILWAFILQAGLQRQVPCVLTTAGAVLISLSLAVPTCWTSLRRWRKSKRWDKSCPHKKDYEELYGGTGSVQVLDND